MPRPLLPGFAERSRCPTLLPTGKNNFKTQCDWTDFNIDANFVDKTLQPPEKDAHKCAITLLLLAVLRIRDVYPWSEFIPSRVRIYSFPDTDFPIPILDPHQKIEEFLPKILFPSYRKYDPGSSFRIRIFYPFPIQGSKRLRIPDPQHWLIVTQPNYRSPHLQAKSNGISLPY